MRGRNKSDRNFSLFLREFNTHCIRVIISSVNVFFAWRYLSIIIFYNSYLTISSCVSVRMSRYWARGKFGEHERGVRVARGAAECNSSLFSAFQTSQVLNTSTYAQLQHDLISFSFLQVSVFFGYQVGDYFANQVSSTKILFAMMPTVYLPTFSEI